VIDKICNAKGLSIGHASVYEKQSLVLVAKPGATSEEVVTIAHELMKRVKDATGIEIEGEVEWVN
jgi:UDP-N-acetylmuramate dehydrogenase